MQGEVPEVKLRPEKEEGWFFFPKCFGVCRLCFPIFGSVIKLSSPG